MAHRPEEPRSRRWLILAFLFALAYALPVLHPPATAPPAPLLPDATIVERLFPGTPSTWLAWRFLCLAASVICLIACPSAATRSFISETSNSSPSPLPPRRLLLAAMVAAIQLAVAPAMGWFDRPLQLLYVAWLFFPTLILVDWPTLASGLRRNLRLLGSTSVLVGLWLLLRLPSTWQSPLTADVLDDWRGMQLFQGALSPSFNLLTDRGMPGAGTSFHFLLEGAAFPDACGSTSSFSCIQASQFLWFAVTALLVAWIGKQIVGKAGALVAVAAFLFSPFVSMSLVTPIPMFFGSLVIALMVLAIRHVHDGKSPASIAALGAIGGVAITWHGSMLAAGVMLVLGLTLAWRAPRMPRLAIFVGLASFLAGFATALPEFRALFQLVHTYSAGHAQWAGHEMAAFGQVSRLSTEYLLDAANPRSFDIPLSALLSPFATPRTPMRLVGDMIFDPLGTALALLGLVTVIRSTRGSWFARLLLACLAMSLAPAMGASTDRLSLNRLLLLPVLMSFLTAIGWKLVYGFIPRRFAPRWTTGCAIAGIIIGGTILFDHANPRILYASWTRLALQSVGEADTNSPVTLLDHPDPNGFPYSYLDEIIAALGNSSIRRVIATPTALATEFRQDSNRSIYLWSPGLEDELRVSDSLCQQWPAAAIYVVSDIAQRSRVFAAAAPDHRWQPRLPPERWTRQACGSELPTELRWATSVIENADDANRRGDSASARRILRQAARQNFGSQALFVRTARELLASSPALADAAEAIVWAQRAAAMGNGKDDRMQSLLADAYVAARRFPEAIAVLDQALRLKSVTTNPARQAELQEQRERIRRAGAARELLTE